MQSNYSMDYEVDSARPTDKLKKTRVKLTDCSKRGILENVLSTQKDSKWVLTYPGFHGQGVIKYAVVVVTKLLPPF